jgi:hypothetical protein
MVVCKQIDPNQRVAPKSFQRPRLLKPPFEKLTKEYCTDTTARIVQQVSTIEPYADPGEITEALLAAKSYDIAVAGLPNLPMSACKDPLLLVWKYAMECVSGSESFQGYVSNLYEIFSSRYKKSVRKSRANVVTALLWTLKDTKFLERTVLCPAVLEAVWKIAYMSFNPQESLLWKV